MALVSLRGVSLAFGGPPLLDDVHLQVEEGERVCLLGRNGSGKTTLLRLIGGELQPDSGQVDRRQGLRSALLSQDVPRDLVGSVTAAVLSGIGPTGALLLRYHRLMRQGGGAATDAEMLALHEQLDTLDGWKLEQQVEQVLSRLHLDGAADVTTFSGGIKRRILLARVLVTKPELLLLDEPTNHLDLDSIAWLEDFLVNSGQTLLFVTHDRSFLRAVATRIVEFDRGQVLSFPGNYESYLQRREEWLQAEERRWQRFDQKLAEEEAWIRQGVKARRTRNQGRLRALLQLREERRQRRERTGTARLQVQEAERSGRLVAELEEVSFAYGERPVVRDLSLTVLRGDRIGIIGPNGAGKTTLLRLLLGELTPQHGRVRHGTNLQVVYFDQLRDQLDPDLTVQQNLSGDQDTVLVAGRPRHVYGYLQDFLFTPDRARTPVRILSGGERNRLLLARLFTREANVLVLDEPTNDLDLETLELLEELLAGFTGTIFLVSHDRAFLDRVVTSTLVFEGDGRIAEYVGGYEDWLRQRPSAAAEVPPPKPERSRPERHRPRKLSFAERQELIDLPARIETLEQQQAELHEQLADPEFYRSQGTTVSEARQRLEELERELASCFGRWEELESLAET
ncbi:ATP-binding cassette domain-containing protein [Desulfuromonas sp. CSMB_57]|uniref:ATP-binding cassette domain-containing protein n=1 Tax=Desulfuromonas sp. CSMB_57 TaxID=2807629 RepID=UPI001CD22A30|nr:ATP-binding cassette domain-containing protein [Desulfuromonas sp. CSMB_57]